MILTQTGAAVRFDDQNLVSHAGLPPVMRVAGLGELVPKAVRFAPATPSRTNSRSKDARLAAEEGDAGSRAGNLATAVRCS